MATISLIIAMAKIKISTTTKTHTVETITITITISSLSGEATAITTHMMRIILPPISFLTIKVANLDSEDVESSCLPPNLVNRVVVVDNLEAFTQVNL